MNTISVIARYSHYKIYDEDNEVIRIVKSKHEAESIIKTYTNWTYKFVKSKKVQFDLPEATF